MRSNEFWHHSLFRDTYCGGGGGNGRGEGKQVWTLLGPCFVKVFFNEQHQELFWTYSSFRMHWGQGRFDQAWVREMKQRCVWWWRWSIRWEAGCSGARDQLLLAANNILPPCQCLAQPESQRTRLGLIIRKLIVVEIVHPSSCILTDQPSAHSSER